MGSYYPSCRWLRGEMKTAALVLILTLLSCTYGQNSVFSPPTGQRCRGRNFDGKRCCTPERPCGLGEGDCDGPGDGGANDGHRGCQRDLVCGSNNCKKFGTYFHEKDDCCDLPETLAIPEPLPLIPAGVPLDPPAGQRCAGRNYNGKRCCTPENPCDEGEGDCDGPGDGGNNDGHRGCKGDLICGSNNCLQFGAYYHPKDDCCERPQGVSLAGGAGSGNVRELRSVLMAALGNGLFHVDHDKLHVLLTPAALHGLQLLPLLGHFIVHATKGNGGQSENHKQLHAFYVSLQGSC